MFRSPRPIVFALLAGLAAAGSGCGDNAPPAPTPPPAQFQFDEATTKAASDPKFADFVKLCQARGVEAKRLEAYNKAHPKPRSDSDQAEFEKIQGAINQATTLIKQAMAAPEWTPEDRKVMQYIFATKAGG